MVCLHAADLSAFTMAIRVRISLSSLLDFFLGGIAPKRQVCPQATMCSDNKSLVQQYKCTRSALLSLQKTTFRLLPDKQAAPAINGACRALLCG